MVKEKQKKVQMIMCTCYIELYKHMSCIRIFFAEENLEYFTVKVSRAGIDFSSAAAKALGLVH